MFHGGFGRVLKWFWEGLGKVWARFGRGFGRVLGGFGGRFSLCIRFPVEFWFQMLCRRFCFWRNLREASRVAGFTLMITATKGRSLDTYI